VRHKQVQRLMRVEEVQPATSQKQKRHSPPMAECLPTGLSTPIKSGPGYLVRGHGRRPQAKIDELNR